jgi:hypothetical protein
MTWPWRRFERFYESALRRSLVESLDSRKEQMIASLWANSNYDDNKGTRKNAIEELEAAYDEAVAKILGYYEEEEEEIDPNNPFFGAVERGLNKVAPPEKVNGTVAQVVTDEYTKYIDQ